MSCAVDLTCNVTTSTPDQLLATRRISFVDFQLSRPIQINLALVLMLSTK